MTKYFKELTTFTCYRSVSITWVDLSANTKLQYLDCINNSLSNLDLSKNTALTKLDVSDNQLTKLNVSKNTKLTTIYLHMNKITDTNMKTFVSGLPKVTKGELRVYSEGTSTEKNDFSSINVNAAKTKGWTVKYYNGTSWLDYKGSATAISDVNVDEPAEFDVNAPAYNLRGERVGNDCKGIVIQKGRKYIRK